MALLYSGASGNSPHRQLLQSHGPLSTMTNKEHAGDVKAAVEEDQRLHRRVSETEQFLARLLHVEGDTVNAILQSMKAQHLYNDQSRRWTGFPDPRVPKTKTKDEKEKKPQERSLYAPFTTIAEAIRKVAETFAGPSRAKMGRANLVDYHSKSPKSQDSQATQLRPDNPFAFQIDAVPIQSNESQVRITHFRDDNKS